MDVVPRRQQLDGRPFNGAYRRRVAAAGDPEGVLIEVGANIGSYTIAMKLRKRWSASARRPGLM